MTIKRIPNSAIHQGQPYQDGEVVTGAMVNEVVKVLKDGVNYNKFFIDAIFAGTTEEAIVIGSRLIPEHNETQRKQDDIDFLENYVTTKSITVDDGQKAFVFRCVYGNPEDDTEITGVVALNYFKYSTGIEDWVHQYAVSMDTFIQGVSSDFTKYTYEDSIQDEHLFLLGVGDTPKYTQAADIKNYVNHGVVDGTTPIAFDNTGTTIEAETLPDAIKELNEKAIVDVGNIDERLDNLETFKNTTVPSTYETIAKVDIERARVTNLETFQTVTVPATYETIANVDVERGRIATLETFKNTTVPATYETKADATSKLALKEDKANKGQPDGYAPLGSDGYVPSAFIPNSFDDVLEFDTYADLEDYETPTTSKLYIVKADETSGGNHSTYRWSGSLYVRVSDEMSASEIKALYESNADTNPYTDAEKSKLGGLLQGSDYYDRNYIDGLQENMTGWAKTVLTPTPLEKAQTIAISDLISKDKLVFVCKQYKDGRPAILFDSIQIEGSDIVNNMIIRFFENDQSAVAEANTPSFYLVTPFTHGGFTYGTGDYTYKLWIYGYTIQALEAQNIEVDPISGMAADDVQEALAELQGAKIPKTDIVNDLTTGGTDKPLSAEQGKTLKAQVDTFEVNVKENELRIDTVEETLRKSVSGDISATVNGEQVLHLPLDVANGQLKPLVEGMTLQAKQFVTNGDFSNGYLGWVFPNENSDFRDLVTYQGKYAVKFVAGAQYGRMQPENLITGLTINDKYYLYAYVNAGAYTGSDIQLTRNDGVNENPLINYNHLANDTWQLLSGISVQNSTTASVRIYDNRVSDWLPNYVHKIGYINISTLIANKQYSPIYNITFDLMSDAQIKAQMGAWVASGELPNDNIQSVSGNKRFKAVGNNLFSPLLSYFGDYYTNADGSLSNNSLFKGYRIKVKPSTTYTISRNIVGNLEANGGIVRFEDINKNLLVVDTSGFSATKITFTTTADTNYIVFSVNKVLDDNLYQLEVGSTATAYEAFTNTELYLQAPNLNRLPNGVKDTIEYRNGKYYHIKRVQEYDLQSGDIDSYNIQIAVPELDYIYISNLTGLYDGSDAITSVLGTFNYNASDLTTTPYTTRYQSSGRIVLRVPTGTYANLGEAQTALAGTKILYQLATPIETEIASNGQLLGGSKYTVYVENAVQDLKVYGANITVTNPIKALDSIIRLNADGSQTSLNVASAVVAVDGLSFTHPSLAVGDFVAYSYYYRDTDNVFGNTVITYFDSRYVVSDTANGKTYRWSISSTNGVASIVLTEVL